ncbi:hypothetical protein DXC40_14140 [Anaerotruncus colihominis]|uniref:Uncharacterized protein n=1 Tax=Anaerotruncus colihominis TaxID=169435 RepID=A0A3E3IH63_9FIRM|nr:hypothetical protein DXC40_14140 [Anaerotruncus colihominis]
MSWHSALRYGWRSGAEACRTIRRSAASCTACPPQADRRRATSAPSRMRGAHWRRCRRRAWPQREANGMRKTAAWRCA